MRSQRFSLLAVTLLLLPIGAGCQTAEPSSNAELVAIYDPDQKDRQAPAGKVDWSDVAARDVARRKRVRELIDQGDVRSGKDYERAAMVFQHGDTPEDILMAHVLAVTALGKGNTAARWLAAASLDRYLHRTEKAQVFGTQFVNKDTSRNDGWTMEPYNRQLLPPSVLAANCVPDREHQAEMLKSIQRDEEPRPPAREPCPKKR